MCVYKCVFSIYRKIMPTKKKGRADLSISQLICKYYFCLQFAFSGSKVMLYKILGMKTKIEDGVI